MIQAQKIVKSSGLANFLSRHIPIRGTLKAEVWRSCWDQQLADLIQYGFPLDLNRDQPLQATMEKHASAISYTADVEEYLSTELSHKAIIGPFAEPPFPIHTSPLMTRPKQEPAKHRTIVDLSWPKQLSVNAESNAI